MATMRIIYVDGSCNNNGFFPNKGGFGAVILDENENLLDTYYETEENTTNNRQELKAILYAFENYGVKQGDIPIVYSDSNYCVQTFNNWMFNWVKKGWLKSNNQPPENLDLIKKYYNLYQEGYRIDLRKIKGHVGHQWNELADKIATGKEKK